MNPRFLLAAGVVWASLACAQTGPAGHWEGTFTVDSRAIGLTLDLAQDASTKWIASMGVPAQNATGLVITELAVNGNSVKFLGVELMMSRFDLTLGAEGKMKGTITGRQNSTPIEFTRTGEAKVELIPPSPAVGKELEGDWEGSLQMPNATFRIIVHFRNQVDRTVAATIDTPQTGGMGLPLNQVVQKGPDVTFGVKIAHASFAGKLNQEATELAGEFRHEEDGWPLMLRKK